MIKHIATAALLGTAMTVAAGASAADRDLSAVLGIDAAAMSDAELAQVDGKAHGTFALGALLLDRANPRLLDTPAWGTRGLAPGFGKGIVRSQAKGL